uniref:Phosphatidylethanolamine binding protein 4 n=1 Tax=Gouania willdenowi TaxID=441366 RepID=A0A8C5GHZ3_GOUWI
MDALVFFVLMCFIGEHFHVEGAEVSLSSEDASFCYGGLEVIYPELKVDKCLVIPKEKRLREKISNVWKAPNVFFSDAQKDAAYILVMVDPDAPRRTLPLAAFWRHWLVVDVQGKSLRKGQIRGKTLTDYHPPTPPKGTGFHRYQFMLFEQDLNLKVSLTEEELSRGKWDFPSFVQRYNLGLPVATVQFLTQNYQD